MFDTRASAEEWAARKELGLRGLSVKDGAINLVPKRTLHAIASVEHGADDVLRGALPAPKSCGIYFLIRKGEIVYVGKTTDVFQRLSKHRRDGKLFDAYNFMPCREGQLDELESRYIAAFLPLGNCRL